MKEKLFPAERRGTTGWTSEEASEGPMRPLLLLRLQTASRPHPGLQHLQGTDAER